MTMTTLEQQLIDDGYMPGKKSFDCLWTQIEANFDFERVQKVMEFLDWRWTIEDYGRVLPTIDRLKMTARQYLYECWNEEKSFSTGGFYYRYMDGNLSIEFTLESWDAD
jgi:hypothetical protein